MPPHAAQGMGEPLDNVHAVIAAIRTLTETYVTLALPTIAEITQLPDAASAEKHVRDMIVAGQIHATIDSPKGTVHFIERTEQYDSKAAVLAMEAAMQQVVGLATKLHTLLGSLAVDQNFLARVSATEGQPQWAEEEAMLSK